MQKPRLYISSHQTALVHNDFGGTGRPFSLWRTLSVTNAGKTVKADGSSITECSLCSSAVHLSRDPRAACDLNGAAQMIRLTTPTEVYTPYQGREGGKSFPLLKDWFLTAHCSLHQREPWTWRKAQIWTLVTLSGVHTYRTKPQGYQLNVPATLQRECGGF